MNTRSTKSVKLVPGKPHLRYDFYRLEVGGYFKWPHNGMKERGRIQSAASIYGKRTKKKFKVRAQGEVIWVTRIR